MKTTLGNEVREGILPLDYVVFRDESMTRSQQKRRNMGFPEEAMTRFRQERGLLRHQKIVKVPRPVIMCQGQVRQAMAAKCSEGGEEDCG